MKNELHTHYLDTVAPALKEELKLANVWQISKIEKVVVTSCVGSQPDRSQAVQDAAAEISLITGQKPVIIKARKSVANFKLREGEAISTKVTLRGRQMYEFLQRLIKTAIPRIRDFRGVPTKSFDGRGNYTLGVADQTIFPEIELDKIKRNIGFDINIVTSSPNDEGARVLLEMMGMPFRKNKKAEAKEEAAAA